MTKKDGRDSLGVLILAAGQGTRMESELPKVLHPLCGLPMVMHVLRSANAMKPNALAVLIGHRGADVKAAIQSNIKELGITRPITYLQQRQQLGSGHAVREAASFLKKYQTVLLMSGDAPLTSFETLYSMQRFHSEQKCQMTVLTGRLANPRGYGRILRSPSGDVLRIVEDPEAGAKEASVNEVNSGTYLAETGPLLKVLKDLQPRGAKKELQLTDAVELLKADGARIMAYVAHNAEEVLGINTRVQLATADRIMNRRLVERLLVAGVSVLDPATTYVDAQVEVGPDTTIEPGTVLRGKTQVGRACRLGPYTMIVNSQIGAESQVSYSMVSGCRVLEKSSIGPFSNLRPETVVGPRAKIGNFTEIKASRIGFGSKVPHLSYIGDAEIAEDVNIGAGTITCNYDGEKKHKTIIAAKAFIGSNVNLIAPVKIGRGAKVGAGSTITEDVPEGSLAIARPRQENKPSHK
jgi:bifunctional UDP-N-acetylglucosamine pyrophosphorylase / glucosamine-1-phosphate N-acetyltransferase